VLSNYSSALSVGIFKSQVLILLYLKDYLINQRFHWVSNWPLLHGVVNCL